MKRSEYEKQQELIATIVAQNPLAAALVKEASLGMRGLIEGLAGSSDTIIVNAVTMRRTSDGFVPVFDEDKH